MDHRIVAVVLALTAIACARTGVQPQSAVGGEKATVDITGFVFKPDILEVPVGTTVTWTNRDEVLHTVTTGVTKNTGIGTYDASPDQRVDGRMDGAATTFSFTFASAGTYRYYCDRHRHMAGTVVVR